MRSYSDKMDKITALNRRYPSIMDILKARDIINTILDTWNNDDDIINEQLKTLEEILKKFETSACRHLYNNPDPVCLRNRALRITTFCYHVPTNAEIICPEDK